MLRQKVSQGGDVKSLQQAEVAQTIGYYLEKIEMLESENKSLKQSLETANRELQLSRSLQSKSSLPSRRPSAALA